jgi:NitT/TauT family transport system substrate-binding protein
MNSKSIFHAPAAILGVAACIITTAGMPATVAAEEVTYLFPAPPILPAFGPIQIAKGNGYFKAEGLEVKFRRAKGGVDVAKQVGVGNADLGGGLADGPIIVRAQGVPVRSVAAFGGRGFMQLVVRADSGVMTPKDLKGKTISVMSFQDTTFYALRGMLASQGLKLSDVKAIAVGPRNVPTMVIKGKAVGCACVPDWIPPFHLAKLKVRIIKSEDYFPHMAQAILASDAILKKRPKMVVKFIRASMRGMKDIMKDPAKAAKDFVKAVPFWKGKDRYIVAVFRYYAQLVYPSKLPQGVIDAERLAKLQNFYISQKIVRKKVPLDQLYTNKYVKASMK